MVVQSVWLFVFLLNAIIIWLTGFSGKCAQYRPLGIVIWTFIIVYLPFTSRVHVRNIPAWQFIGTIILLTGITLATVSWIRLLKEGVKPYTSQPSRLITEGPYKIVRHPQYLALIIIFIGISVARGAIISIYLIPFIVIFHWVEALLEEKFVLEKEFPRKYKKYRQNTGMLLPKLK